MGNKRIERKQRLEATAGVRGRGKRKREREREMEVGESDEAACSKKVKKEER